MPKFLTEHEMPGAGQKSLGELVGIARAANAAVRDCGATCLWQTAWICDSSIFCVDIADSEQAVRDFCAKYGLPPVLSCNRVRFTFDPASVACDLDEASPPVTASSCACGDGCTCGDECLCGDDCTPI